MAYNDNRGSDRDRRPSSGGRGPARRDERGPARGPRRDDDRRGPARDGERRPFAGGPRRDDDRRGPARGDEGRPFRSRDDRPARDGERRSFTDRPRRDDDRRSPARDGERRPFGDRDRRDERPRRDGDRPFRSRDDRPARDGERRPFGDRDRRDDRPRRDGDRPFRSRDDRPARDGERRSFSDRPRRDDDRRGPARDGERRPFGDRDRRDDRPRRDGDRPFRSRDDRPGRDTRPRRDEAMEPRARRGGDPEKLPAVPDDIDVTVLPRPVLAELKALSPGLSIFLMEHLACALHALEAEDFELALAHARAARTRGARIAVVRETCGIAAYHCEQWAEALSELRTYTRITGSPEHLPIMADCERGMGRPERALTVARSQDVGRLDVEGRVEMRIVAAGARRDLGQLEAAIATLECKELTSRSTAPWAARLRYAYADLLLAAGRRKEARDWFVKATLVDAEDLTDAAERAMEIDV